MRRRAKRDPPAHASPRRPSVVRFWTTGVALLVICAAIYWPVRTYSFVNWDDHEYVAENPNVTAGLSVESAARAFAQPVAGNWHPLTILSHQLDVELFGLDAGAHHVVNVAIHAINTLLIFLLLAAATGAVGRSAFVAAVFAAHPLHVESVAWISERKDVLSTLFLLLTISAYAAYVRRPHWRRYALVCVCFVLALLAKPMVVTLPFALLLLDVWPLARLDLKDWRVAPLGRLLLEKLPLVAAAVAVGIVTLQTQAVAIAGLDVMSPGDRLSQTVTSYVAYLRLTFWPTGLAGFYPREPIGLAAAAGATLVLVAVTGAALATRRQAPYVLAGWLWYLLTLAPVIGLVQAGDQARADRYTYVAMLGILAALAWAVVDAARARRWPVRPIAGTAAAAVLALAVAAGAQVTMWADSVALWRRTIAATERNARAHENLGAALRDAGDLNGAVLEYERALAAAPDDFPPARAARHNGRGLVLAQLGRFDEAVAELERALDLRPDFTEARANLGNALAGAGRHDEAARCFQQVLAASPDAVEAHVGMGGVQLARGQLSDAEASYRRAIQLAPRLPEAHNGLGAVLARAGHLREAAEAVGMALRLDPDFTSARVNLAAICARQGRLADAAREIDEALRRDPGSPVARQAKLQLGR